MDMTTDELVEIGNAIFGWGWQRKIAHILDRNERTVRRWRTGELRVPDEDAARLRALYAAADGEKIDGEMPVQPLPPEWIIGTEAHGTDEKAAEYLIHTRRPRFIARIVDATDPADDTAPPGGLEWTDEDWSLSNFQWIDEQPRDSIGLGDLMRRAMGALA